MKQSKMSKYVRNGILLLFFLHQLSISTDSYCQTFESVYNSPNDEIAIDALEFTNESFLITISSGNFDAMDYSGILLHLSNDGSIIDSVLIEPPQGYNLASITNLFQISDTLILLTGICYIPGYNNYYLYFIHLNEFLEVTYSNITINYTYETYFMDYLINKNNNLVVAGNDVSDFTQFIYEYDLNGEIVDYKHYYDSTSSFPFAYSIIELDNISKYHLHATGSNNMIWVIDRVSLKIDTVINYLAPLTPRDCIHGIESNSYFLPGDYYKYDYGINVPSFYKINFQGEIIDTNTYIYSPDTNSYYGGSCFDYLNNTIYQASCYNYSNSPPFFFNPEHRWIWLNKLSPNGSVIWQKFYKGEVNYWPYKVLATSDGGALILSTKYDWNNPIPMQRDVHILKIDSLGYYTPLTGTEEEVEQMNKQILVYPNPVKDKVNFVFGLYQNLEINLFNLMGELLLSETYKSSATIDISRLPTGTYIYKIAGKNGFFEEGKLVKQ